MLFLSVKEKQTWENFGTSILKSQITPDGFDGNVRSNLYPAFCFFAGTLLAAKGHEALGIKWLQAGVEKEEDGLFLNAFMTSFLEHQNHQFIMPDVAFKDPRPFVHFSGVPAIKKSRQEFLVQCGHSMPYFEKPVRIMDIGCGNGALVSELLNHLKQVGKIKGVSEILLIDASPAMIELAKETVSKHFSPNIIKTINSKIEKVSDQIDSHYDIALSSLAYHHMPMEKKIFYLNRMKKHIDHFVIFELDANNDSPELFTPELSLSVYQSYGRIIDFVFAHDAPVEVAQACVDCFLMTEAVSLLSQPRGERTEYHMRRIQWHELFQETLSPEFSCFCDSTCYADEYLDLFTMHYGRN